MVSGTLNRCLSEYSSMKLIFFPTQISLRSGENIVVIKHPPENLLNTYSKKQDNFLRKSETFRDEISLCGDRSL